MDSVLVTLLLNAGVAGAWVICNLLGLQYPRSAVADLKEDIKAKDIQLDAKDIALAAQRDRADALERLIVATMAQSGVKVPDVLLTGPPPPALPVPAAVRAPGQAGVAGTP